MKRQEIVEQPLFSKKCGHACLSMITGEDIIVIARKLQNYNELSLEKEIMWYLKDKGYNVKMVTKFEMSSDEIPNNSIVRIEDINENGHFVLKQNDVFKDPNIGIVKSYISRKRFTHYLELEL
ncbi:hypothetical protein [Tenacibaculum jejuense]|uniref:Uncharacterized protein n=1 Tax=Tenacibaculum jejuense TaxID=584609 RepID=A0A238UBT2_9FLAO|nr:hypothetical protein [Tenacibaculum jejuense]SNR16552.1 protein of unknown function [Tenacibaculum jejuense]